MGAAGRPTIQVSHKAGPAKILVAYGVIYLRHKNVFVIVAQQASLSDTWGTRDARVRNACQPGGMRAP